MRPQSQTRLDHEIALLRERLEGAEEMRRALVAEELDGFVVGHDTDEQHVVLLETSALATRPLLERLPHSAVTVSKTGEILYANQRFADRLGRSLANLFSASIADMIAPESRRAFDDYLAAAVADSSVEVTLVHRDGTRLRSRVSIVAIGNGHTSLLITELDPAEALDEARQALEAIHEGAIDGVVVGGEEVVLVGRAQASYRAVVDRMQQGAVTISRDGDVLYANERFASMVGRTRDWVLGKPLRAVIGAAAADEVRALDRSDYAPAELTLLHADGGRIRAGITAERVDGDGAVTLVLTDLTERDRHLEMQERARRNDRFLAVLAHELRNPLGAVRNAVEILNRSQSLREGERFAVDVIGRQSETLMRLVDDLLDIHRLNEDKIVLRRSPVDLREVIERAIEAARPSFAAKEQRIDVNMPAGALHVDADVVRLAQVLGNVLVNASKFTPVGGRVEIVLEGGVAASGAGVACIRVTDNGIGVAPNLLDKLFEPYMQAPHEGQQFPEGLGLGLSVARRLVELHGGTIEAHSAGVGTGTTLRVELPTCPPAAAVASAAEPVAALPSGARLRILIADDDEDSVRSLSHLLELLGHETYTARNGVQALAMADELRPQVAILDVGMPRMDGWTAGRTLRARPWAEGLILYAMTGWSQQHARERTREAGFDRHFAKPIEFAELVRDLHGRMAKAEPGSAATAR